MEDAHRRHWLELLEEWVHRFRLRVYAYAMMNNHTKVVQAVESVRGMEWDEFQSRRGDWGRDLAWYFGQRESGLALRELGELSGGVDYATVSAGARRMERRLTQDKAMAQKAKQVF